MFAFRFNESENRWESSGLVVLTSFLLVIYVLWLIVSLNRTLFICFKDFNLHNIYKKLKFSCRYHHRVFKDWQHKNQIVILHIEEEKAIESMMLLNQSLIKNNIIDLKENKINQAFNQSINNGSDQMNQGAFALNHNVKIINENESRHVVEV